MELVSIEQKKNAGFFSLNNRFVAEKKHQADLGNFLKGTISGDELVKYVCDRLDKKYNDKD